MLGLTRYRFQRIRKATHGLLKARVYREIYRQARRAEEGIMVDIGPAQGASAIAIGLGIRDSGKSASRVYSIELGRGSHALRDLHDAELNERVLRHNLERFGVAPFSTVLMGSVETVADRVPEKPISLLFIDADGALDRDFRLFYPRLLPGAPVILDDYAEIVDRKFLDYTDEALARYFASRRRQGKYGSSLARITPLGKQYTTYRFIRHFLERGILEQEQVIRKTFFGRKPAGGPVPAIEPHALEAVRQEIVDRFLAMRATV